MIDMVSHLILGHPAWMWLAFLTVIGGLLVFDLGFLHRVQKNIGVVQSLLMYGFYFSLALMFGVWIMFEMGTDKALLFYNGLLVEQTLSMDNLFVMSLIFGFFGISREYQHRALFWGILGVLVLRGVMIGAGSALVANFHWVLYIFSAFLIYAGYKAIKVEEEDGFEIENTKLYKFLTRHLRITKDGRYLKDQFFVTIDGLKYATPLFVALVMIEIADVIFAVDSIPAIFTITTDPFIVYTSNIFAILGLRSLYFALAALMDRFAYLKYAISVILVFIGSKIFLHDFTPIDITPVISLGVTIGLLATGIIYSLWRTKDAR